jgi:hypothetical protein
VKVVNPGEAESVQVGYHRSSKMPAKATDRWGIAFATGPVAKGSARSAPSLRSIVSGRRSGAQAA